MKVTRYLLYSHMQLGYDFEIEDLTETARQMTIIEFELYKKLCDWEFFNLAWTKKGCDIASPNITNLTQHFNHVNKFLLNVLIRFR
jgi:hypothetical protein